MSGFVRVGVRYYATLADAAGRQKEDVLFEGSTLADLLAALVSRYDGRLSEVAKTAFSADGFYFVEVNGERARDAGLVLRDGDEVSLLMPLVGG